MAQAEQQFSRKRKRALPGTTFEFEPFLLEADERRLLCEDRPVPLRGRVFDTLLALVERAGHLLTKDELLEAIWPDTIVEESNLAHNISVLRKALAEVAPDRTFVETVPRQGYRFVADVRRVQLHLPAGIQALRREPKRPIVGRGEELATLEDLWRQAREGRRRTVFVSGPPGTGKTSLVRELLRRATAEGEPRIGHGQCVELLGPGEAYLPLLEALGRMCRQAGGGELRDLLRRVAPTWLAQLPALVDPEDRPDLDALVRGTTRERMLRELVELLEAASQDRPLLLVLEDLNWSDPSTVDFLVRWAQGEIPARVLVVATLRPGDVQRADHPLSSRYREMVARGLAREIALDLLGEAAVRDLLERRFPGAGFPASVPGSLHARTEGHPLFLENVIRSWVDRGLLVREDPASDADPGPGSWTLEADPEALTGYVPENVRELIDQQVERLDEGERELLEVAGVAGMVFSAATLACCLDEEIETIETRCQDLARRGSFLLQKGLSEWADGTLSGRFGFRHALYREILHDRVPPARRVRLHRAIGHRLEAALGPGTGERAAELATHFVHGREPEAAIRWLVRAAENAVHRSAHQDAVSHLREGLELLDSVPASRERDEMELSLRAPLGPALIATLGWKDEELDGNFARARELCRRLEDPPEAVPVLCGLATVHEFRGEYRRSREILESRLDEIRDDPDSVELMACSLYHQGKFEESLENADRVLSLLDPDQHSEFLGSFGVNPSLASHTWAALDLWCLGYPLRALERNRIARELGERHAYSLAFADVQASFLHQFRRDPEASRDAAVRAIDLAARQGFLARVAQASIHRGWAMALLGDPEEGLRELQEGIDAYRETGAEMDVPYFLTLESEVLEILGRRDPALERLQEAEEVLQGERAFFWEPEILRRKAGLLEGDQGLGLLHRALELARDQNGRSLSLRTSRDLAEGLAERDRREEARDLLREEWEAFPEPADLPDHREVRELLERL